jgi:hypothetical protein
LNIFYQIVFPWFWQEVEKKEKVLVREEIFFYCILRKIWREKKIKFYFSKGGKVLTAN